MLSKVGITQLINSTLSSLSSHIKKAFLLPKGILNIIDRKSTNFFYGHTENNRKIHTINQDRITRPKLLGGLGIKRAEHQNKVHLLNSIWRFFNSLDKEWTKILIEKYGKDLKKKNRKNINPTDAKTCNDFSLFTSLVQNPSQKMIKQQSFGMIAGSKNLLDKVYCAPPSK